METTIRSVDRHNFRHEIEDINKRLFANPQRRTFLSMDTEFPGIPDSPPSSPTKESKPYYLLSSQESYDAMRETVNKTKLIQLGLAISDEHQGCKNVWEFNFRDFDIEKDEYSHKSISFLTDHGLDLAKIRTEGICCNDFAAELMKLLMRARNWNLELTWVFFHCTYDLGYLVKVLTQQPLPEKVETFFSLVQAYLGSRVFDLKLIVSETYPECRKLGLLAVAEEFGVGRLGQSHHAGSDSLLTLDCFFAVFKSFTARGKKGEEMWKRLRFKLHGFDDIPPPVLENPINRNPQVMNYGGLTMNPVIQKHMRSIPQPNRLIMGGLENGNHLYNHGHLQQHGFDAPLLNIQNRLPDYTGFQNAVWQHGFPAIPTNPGLQNINSGLLPNPSGLLNKFGQRNSLNLKNPDMKKKKKQAPSPRADANLGSSVDYHDYVNNHTVKSQ